MWQAYKDVQEANRINERHYYEQLTTEQERHKLKKEEIALNRTKYWDKYVKNTEQIMRDAAAAQMDIWKWQIICSRWNHRISFSIDHLAKLFLGIHQLPDPFFYNCAKTKTLVCTCFRQYESDQYNCQKRQCCLLTIIKQEAPSTLLSKRVRHWHKMTASLPNGYGSMREKYRQERMIHWVDESQQTVSVQVTLCFLVHHIRVQQLVARCILGYIIGDTRQSNAVLNARTQMGRKQRRLLHFYLSHVLFKKVKKKTPT